MEKDGESKSLRMLLLRGSKAQEIVAMIRILTIPDGPEATAIKPNRSRKLFFCGGNALSRNGRRCIRAGRSASAKMGGQYLLIT